MKAVRFVGAGCSAQVVDLPTPRPGPGEVLVQSTINLAVRVLGYDSHLAIVGLGGGVMSFSPGTAEGCVPWGCSVTAPYAGTRLHLMEVIALAEAGMIEAEKTCFRLEDAVSVYSSLEKGEIHGRAVFVPA